MGKVQTYNLDPTASVSEELEPMILVPLIDMLNETSLLACLCGEQNGEGSGGACKCGSVNGGGN